MKLWSIVPNASFPNQRYSVNQEFSVHDGTFQAISSTAVSNGSAYWSQMEPSGRALSLRNTLTRPGNAFIWPIMMPARRYLLLNVARAQIGPDKREETGQTA